MGKSSGYQYNALILGAAVIAVVVVAYFYGQDRMVVAPQLPGTIPETPLEIDIYFTKGPEQFEVGEEFEISWRIDSNQEKIITHTAVYYNYESRQGEFSSETTPKLSGYEGSTPEFASTPESPSGEFKIPNTFAGIIKPEKEGPIYIRAHAIVDGKNYWSEEDLIKSEIEEILPVTVDRRTLQ